MLSPRPASEFQTRRGSSKDAWSNSVSTIERKCVADSIGSDTLPKAAGFHRKATASSLLAAKAPAMDAGRAGISALRKSAPAVNALKVLGAAMMNTLSQRYGAQNLIEAPTDSPRLEGWAGPEAATKGAEYRPLKPPDGHTHF